MQVKYKFVHCDSKKGYCVTKKVQRINKKSQQIRIMDKQKDKKHVLYGSHPKYFEGFGNNLAADYPIIGTFRTNFTQKYAVMILIVEEIYKINVDITFALRRIRPLQEVIKE